MSSNIGGDAERPPLATETSKSVRFVTNIAETSSATQTKINDEYLEQIRQFPRAEQILLVERIWDGLHQNAIIHDWQRQEGQRRLSELQADPSLALTEEQMWQQVDDLLDG